MEKKGVEAIVFPLSKCFIQGLMYQRHVMLVHELVSTSVSLFVCVCVNMLLGH